MQRRCLPLHIMSPQSLLQLSRYKCILVCLNLQASTSYACLGHKMESATVWLGIAGLITIAILMSRSFRGSVFMGILLTTIVAWIPGHAASYLGSSSPIPGEQYVAWFWSFLAQAANVHAGYAMPMWAAVSLGSRLCISAEWLDVGIFACKARICLHWFLLSDVIICHAAPYICDRGTNGCVVFINWALACFLYIAVLQSFQPSV